MRTPNSEQQAAIKSRGGLLLQAGAGSGKTFVLVEHIYSLITEFISMNRMLEPTKFEIAIKKYLSSIVLMTFTNKAAGELAIRLKEKIEQSREVGSNDKLWEIASSQLGQLFVGTIHSFCLKLILEGHFTEVATDATHISENELHIILSDGLDNFFRQHTLPDRVLRIIRANRDSLLKSIVEIFLDASLRINWEKIHPEEMVRCSLAEITSSLLEHLELSGLFSKGQWEVKEEDRDKTWAQYLMQSGESLSCAPCNLDEIKSHWDFFQSYQRLPSVPKHAESKLRERFIQLKKYRDFLKENYESFVAYEEHKNEIVLQWCQWLKKIFVHLNQYYGQLGHMTFSDLEYITLKGLEKLQHKKKIYQRYKYLIVDEFQDTSRVQFDILRHIINDDFTRLFVVGDIKQAIYGFRGGEVSVFKDCAAKIPRKLELKNNYRSAPNIIAFNNHFFTDIFPLGRGFKGRALMQTPVIHQIFPEGKGNGFLGEVGAWIKEIDNENKPSVGEINFWEAQEIFKLLKQDHWETTCILYKKLAPSLELLKQMLKKKMSFTAQVKISRDEGPILMIFYQLIKSYLSGRETKSTLFLINKAFAYLQVESFLDQKKLNDFYLSLEEIGPYYAYIQLLFERGVSNSMSDVNLSFILALLEACHGDIERFYLCFDRVKKDSFSFEFQTGAHPKKIQIMTVHAAKGLEFDRVILGGIHSNGRRSSDATMFGKWPGSFKWKSRAGQVGPYKSPSLILEEWENKHKELSEDKRLFYVAASRAKKNLSWIDFSFSSNLRLHTNQNWIDAFHSGLSSETKYLIQKNAYPSGKQMQYQGDIKSPFFQQNPLGIRPIRQEGGEIFILGELSVTGLSTLAQCPRKFYLNNILKLSPRDIVEVSIVGEGKSLSSADRGIKIHREISLMIQNGLEGPETEIMKWIKQQLIPYENSRLISERMIKFPLFGLMISGVPDLIIKDNDKTMIWDFKTGAKREDDNHYWLQLKLYALAQWEFGDVKKSNSIELSLLYLDLEKKVSSLVSFDQIRKEIFTLWRFSNSIHKVNREHCPQCDYGKLCRF